MSETTQRSYANGTMDAGSLELSEHLAEPHHHLGDLRIIDDVAHALPADCDVARRIGDDQADVEELLESIRHRHLRDLKRVGDLGPRLSRVLPQVSDDRRLHHVPESLDGILRVLTVRGACVAGHSLSLSHAQMLVQMTEAKSASQCECSVIRFPHVKTGAAQELRR